MSFYDIIILVVLFGAMFFGYAKGLAWQIASVAAVVVSYIVSIKFRGQVAQFVQVDPPLNTLAAMLIIFVASSLFIWLAYAYVNKSIEKAELDGFNRQMGALVGSVLGILLVMVITMFSVSLLGQTAHDSIHNSRLGRYVVRGISMAQDFVPQELEAALDPHFEKFYQQYGYNGNQPQGTFTQGFDQNVVPGGSQYAAGQTFNSGNQTSYQGNWSSGAQPGQETYQNSGYQNNGYQPSQTQTGYGYQAAPSNQGTNYTPQQQQQSSGLPPIQLKLDTETLINGAGQWLKNSITDPNGN